MKKINPELNERLEKVIRSMGYVYWGAERVNQGRSTTLRVYIDQPEIGVTVDDCANVSRQLSAMFDVEDPFNGAYSLEVSSPGIDRPLFSLSQYEALIGQSVKIHMLNPIDTQRKFTGVIHKIEGTDIYLLLDGSELVIKLAFSDIEKANLVGKICL